MTKSFQFGVVVMLFIIMLFIAPLDKEAHDVIYNYAIVSLLSLATIMGMAVEMISGKKK